MKSHLLHELTSLDIKNALLEKPERVAIFCLGSIEQHGSHLPLGTDILSSQDRAVRIAKKTGAIVCVSTMAGYSPQHKNFHGTITLRQETLSNIIYDTITSLKQHKFNRILILNAHTSNASIIESTILKIKEKHDISIAFSKNYPSEFIDVFQKRKYKTLDIHAGVSETSVMKAIAPELVDEEYINKHIPSNEFEYFKTVNDKNELNDVEKLLFETLMPVQAEKITKNGVYGSSDITKADADLYLNNIDKTIDFYVNFIKEWEKVNV